ncbi:uncharacterized protein LOC132266206 [Cornus florida]|uniref:uncharacterized protein LOC132266206 n=1 Tax=Cornus florida TaxID=4283 RepID=UPI00289A3EF8|nr:uncharacterized protein LOC132266206 [Cornus florida]
MSVSLEALAMAGANYVEWGMDIEEWERRETPPHLLAEEEEEVHLERVNNNAFLNTPFVPDFTNQLRNDDDDEYIGEESVGWYIKMGWLGSKGMILESEAALLLSFLF